jgi:hypothetical protein
MSNVFRLLTWSSRDRTTDLRQRIFSLTQQKASTIISSIEGNRVPAFETKNSVSAEAIGTICQKTHCSGGAGGVCGMTQREEYLLRAAELSARAQAEGDSARKAEFENMARAYLRLAEQAERNSLTDIVYETPPKKDRDQA